MPEWGTVASLGLGLAALVTALGSWFKIRADADTGIGSMALAMVKEVRLDVDKLKVENKALQAENDQLRADLDAMQTRLEDKDRQITELLDGVATLCTQVRQAGAQPWFVPKKKGEGAI
jgi:hypothetical protein